VLIIHLDSNALFTYEFRLQDLSLKAENTRTGISRPRAVKPIHKLSTESFQNWHIHTFFSMRISAAAKLRSVYFRPNTLKTKISQFGEKYDPKVKIYLKAFINM